MKRNSIESFKKCMRKRRSWFKLSHALTTGHLYRPPVGFMVIILHSPKPEQSALGEPSTISALTGLHSCLPRVGRSKGRWRSVSGLSIFMCMAEDC